ncbi:hypothetical protein M422DRAFT_43124 [Sphaerobolus stellatus SS14]|nr:hypothetical protein M422DRAFT_43124 [Sphaerobolus stellatus SS14]
MSSKINSTFASFRNRLIEETTTNPPVEARPRRNRVATERGANYAQEIEQEKNERNAKQSKKKRTHRAPSVMMLADPIPTRARLAGNSKEKPAANKRNDHKRALPPPEPLVEELPAVDNSSSPPRLNFAQIRKNNAFSSQSSFVAKSKNAPTKTVAPAAAGATPKQAPPKTATVPRTTQSHRLSAVEAIMRHTEQLGGPRYTLNPKTPAPPSQATQGSRPKRPHPRSPETSSVRLDVPTTIQPASKRSRVNIIAEEATDTPNDGDTDESKEVLKTARGRKVRGLKSLDTTARLVVEAAVPEYRVKLATKCPFPTTSDEQEMATNAIINACIALQKNIGTSNELDNACRVLTARDSQMRGELKTKAAPIVAKHFGFDGRGSKKAEQKNRHLAALLKSDNRIIFKDFKGRQGPPYRTPILQEIINEMWFSHAYDEGVTFTNDFKPIPLQTIALVLTVVEHLVDCWGSGHYISATQLQAQVYEDYYQNHMKSLEKLDKHSTEAFETLLRMRWTLYHRAMRRSGFKTSSKGSAERLLTQDNLVAFVGGDGNSDTSTDENSGEDKREEEGSVSGAESDGDNSAVEDVDMQSASEQEYNHINVGPAGTSDDSEEEEQRVKIKRNLQVSRSESEAEEPDEEDEDEEDEDEDDEDEDEDEDDEDEEGNDEDEDDNDNDNDNDDNGDEVDEDEH